MRRASGDVAVMPSSGLGGERFFASPGGLRRKRQGLLAGVALVVVTAFVVLHGWRLPVLIVAVIVGLAFAFERHLRRQFRPGEPLVTLTDEFIAAPNLAGGQRYLRWADIERIRVDAIQQTPALVFELKEGVGGAARSFWSGVDPHRPMLLLTPFNRDDTERLIAEVERRHARWHGFPDDESGVLREMVEERQFEERLRAWQPFAWSVAALIGINLVVWLLTLFNGAGVGSAGADKLLLWGGNAASEVQKGDWWRLVSATFLHSGLMHVAMNMFGLYAAGVTVERIYGSYPFLLIYFASGLLGSALSLHFSAQQTVSVGASGAVFGITGALLVAVLQHRGTLPRTFSKQTISGVGFFILYSLVQGFTHPGIDNAAHIGGLLGGCLTALILPERFDFETFNGALRQRALAAFVAAGVAIVAVAVAAPPASLDQRQLLASNDVAGRALQSFSDGLQALYDEQAQLNAGGITEKEVDERSRNVHAPVFRQVADDLSHVILRPGDPRQPLIKDAQRMSVLLAESLGMASVDDPPTGRPQPADPKRMAEISAEIAMLNSRLAQDLKALRGPGLRQGR
ncbi:rhomboid family protein [Propionivibrio soli]|uniref:rhomboid family protein n=1 Tax=Propionivibrio soli TaxID=2976531 RepID=UPI0021E804AC|nr:rhomboid family intramembrane serine protease [Propionivibrio soli]